MKKIKCTLVMEIADDEIGKSYIEELKDFLEKYKWSRGFLKGNIISVADK